MHRDALPEGDHDIFNDNTGLFYRFYEEIDSYNPDGTLSEVLFQDDSQTGQWINHSRVIYNYESLAAPSFTNPKDFLVYPNPASDVLYIRGRELSGLPYRLSDASGRSVRSGSINGNEEPVDLRGLASGIYFLKLGNAAAVKVSKK